MHIDDYNADLALKTYVLSKKRLNIKKYEKSTMHVYKGTFLGMHDGNHWMKSHYARLLRTARLFGKP